jgi:hypothetical protein
VVEAKYNTHSRWVFVVFYKIYSLQSRKKRNESYLGLTIFGCQSFEIGSKTAATSGKARIEALCSGVGV